jgi:hypothetical protein
LLNAHNMLLGDSYSSSKTDLGNTC